MLRGFINWIYHMVVLYILFKAQQDTTWFVGLFQGTNTPVWFEGKFRDFIILGSVSLLTSLGNLVIANYRLPLILNVTQCNQMTSSTRTVYARGETGQKNRTVVLTVSVKRCIGLNSLLRYYLKRYKIYVLVECNPSGLELQAYDELLKPDEIIPTMSGSGFYLDITNYLHSISNHNCCAEPSKSHPFFIKDSREARTFINGNAKCYINPSLKVGGFKDAPRLLKAALQWNPQQHEIEYNNGGIGSGTNS